MTKLLDVYLEGLDAPIGQLTGNDDKSLGFSYSQEAVAANIQLSISLPVAQETFTDHRARGFFANLLQENNSLELVMARHRIDRDDIAGLLYHVGHDCPGRHILRPAWRKTGQNAR